MKQLVPGVFGALVVLAIASALYFVAYTQSIQGWRMVDYDSAYLRCGLNHKWPWARKVFAPARALDRAVRPRRWNRAWDDIIRRPLEHEDLLFTYEAVPEDTLELVASFFVTTEGMLRFLNPGLADGADLEPGTVLYVLIGPTSPHW